MKTLRSVALPAILLVIFLAIWQFLAPDTPPSAHVPYSEFIALVRADKAEPHVESVRIRDNKYLFWVKDPRTGSKTKKITVGPQGTHEVAKELSAAGVSVTFE